MASDILTDAELTEIRERCDKATPGPWEAKNWRVCHHVHSGRIGVICDTATNNKARTEENAANAQLIAAAPRLLSSHAALAKQAEEMRDAAATLSRIAHLGYGGPNLRHAIEQVNTLLAATAARQTDK